LDKTSQLTVIVRAGGHRGHAPRSGRLRLRGQQLLLELLLRAAEGPLLLRGVLRSCQGSPLLLLLLLLAVGTGVHRMTPADGQVAGQRWRLLVATHLRRLLAMLLLHCLMLLVLLVLLLLRMGMRMRMLLRLLVYLRLVGLLLLMLLPGCKMLLLLRMLLR